MSMLMTREEFDTYIRPRRDFIPVVAATKNENDPIAAGIRRVETQALDPMRVLYTRQ